MKRLFLILIAILFPLISYGQRELININQEWQFTPGWEVKKGVSTTVDLPHTWNQDALSGKQDYYRGLGNYIKFIEIPHNWSSKRVFIRFKGSNHTTTLLLNNRFVGTHKGGYSAFTYEITDYLKFGGENSIWARVSNAQDLELMPLVGSFNVYGGIYRDVELFTTPKTHFDAQNYGSSGVFITSSEVSTQSAKVNLKTSVKGIPGDFIEYTARIKDATDSIAGETTRRVKIAQNGVAELTSSFNITEPNLWEGVANPYLYRAELTLRDEKGRAEDQIIQNFGIRTVAVDSENQFLLNDKPIKIQGVVRHQDWATLGNALHPINHQRDIELLQEMGVNAVRLANGAHDPYFIELCDRAGIMVWSEIPFIGAGSNRYKGYINSPAFRENGKEQLREMIRQLYNHPSIVMWGLFNELIEAGDNPLEYIRELNQLAKTEDPTRLTVAASNQNGEMNFIPDIIAFSKYYGWNDGRIQNIKDWGVSLKGWNNLKAGVSEYGAGANIYQQSSTLKKTDPKGAWHPEQWQAHLHEEHWKIISDNTYFWGTFAWAMFDYGVAHHRQGQMKGVSDKGLVTFDRATKKDAFYFYKANWNKKEPFVHIADRRLQPRPTENGKLSIKIYSNQQQVDILIDGRDLYSQEADGTGIFRWNELELSDGEHSIKASTEGGESDHITFRVIEKKDGKM